MILVECRGADLPLGIERRSIAMRTTRSPVIRLSPSVIFRRFVVAPLRRRWGITSRELGQCLDGILRLRWTRAIGRRGVLRKADMMLLRRVEGVDGGQRGFALVGRRAVGLLSLGGFVLVGRHGGKMGWALRCCYARIACLLLRDRLLY